LKGPVIVTGETGQLSSRIEVWNAADEFCDTSHKEHSILPGIR
jgi:hypothetical protein